MVWDSLKQLASDVNAGKTSTTDLVAKSLQAIQEAEDYGAIIEVNPKAEEQAKTIDERVSNGENAGPLAGVPFIAKDNFLTFGTSTTAASNILKDFKAPYQSSAVNKLEAAGAILVAKANLDSFAHGSSTENSDYGPTKNPHDPTRVPGGSSGGSAAAVALELAPLALGTDTGGSIRLPASFTGTVGYKPTYGLVSRFGVIAMASSTDVIGPITKTVEDTAFVLSVIAGRDKLDSTTIESEPESFNDLNMDLKGKRFGLVKQHLGEGLQTEVRKAIEATKERLESAGAIVEEVSLPSLELALACYYIIMPAEVSSNLSRYDGIRYGYSDPQANVLDEVYDFSRSGGFNSEVTRRIMLGTYVLSSGYYDAYYKKAQTVRTKLIKEMQEVHSKVDFLLGPVAPTTAFKLGEKTDDPLTMYLADIMTVGTSLTGNPAISVPFATEGMSIGIQLSADQRKDRELLAAAKAVEELNRGGA